MGNKRVLVDGFAIAGRYGRLGFVFTLIIVGSTMIGYSQDREGRDREERASVVLGHELLAVLAESERSNEHKLAVTEIQASDGKRPEPENDTELPSAEERGSRPNNWYVRPEPKVRFNRYISSIAGPVALMRYAAVAGVLTYRNAPKEWGGRSDGFARRFASNIGESAIKNTIKFGMDEALEVDSHFYLSKKRSVSARARNSVFSAVTARNQQGKRVLGLPKLVGNVVSNVVSAEVWYPSRYDYVHGLKGAAISTGVDAAINLVREFILKR